MSAENYPGGEFVGLEDLFDRGDDLSRLAPQELVRSAAQLQSQVQRLQLMHLDSPGNETWMAFNIRTDPCQFNPDVPNPFMTVLIYSHKFINKPAPSIRILTRTYYDMAPTEKNPAAGNLFLEDLLVPESGRAISFCGIEQTDENGMLEQSKLEMAVPVPMEDGSFQIWGYTRTPWQDVLPVTKIHWIGSEVSLENYNAFTYNLETLARANALVELLVDAPLVAAANAAPVIIKRA